MKTSAASKPDLESASTPSRSPVVFDRLALLSDGLAVGVAASLPWSTSVTGILLGLWLITLIPTLDFMSLRREVMTPAGGLPVVLWVMGAIGMLWAGVSWSERIDGLSGFHKLLAVPLLLAQFRRGGRASWVVVGFLASCVTLLVFSWGLAVIPGLAWRGKRSVGVPVKDYILQSELFAICAFGLIGQAVEMWRSRMRLALILVLVAAAFIGNLLYVETARTTLVVMVVLLVVFGFWKFGWMGALSAFGIVAVLSVLAWNSSPYLRERVAHAVNDVRIYETSSAVTTVGLRLGYWRTSLAFVAEAPMLGNGTGSIPELFRRGVTAETDPQSVTTNPHNQILVVALDLGLCGTIVLIAMWIAHFVLFREPSLISWFGLVIVVQNIVACLFNSHLFDFTQGWLYVMGVGVCGGSVLHVCQKAPAQSARLP
jgi:O-antigen ligase